MNITPTNEVRLYKNVPFYLDYKNIRQFESTTEQENYFNSLVDTLLIDKVTYTRSIGIIKVPFNRDKILDYNYMSFVNKDYGNKRFYAFINKIEYVNPNASKVYFVIDEWQTWCFNLSFRESFIERKHCVRWTSEGLPQVNTEDEGLDIGNEYIVKDHAQYNNELYWVCFVTSLETGLYYLNTSDVPTILEIYYQPIYKNTNSSISSWNLNGQPMLSIGDTLTYFRNDESFVGKLKSCFILSEAPFDYSYTISGSTINISSSELTRVDITGSSNTLKLGLNVRQSNPKTITRSFSKYGNLKSFITESKLLMYPYSFVQLIDGAGNTFDIKLEQLYTPTINVKTFTSAGINSKQAHIVEHYRYDYTTLNNCRWELGNGIINSFPNQLTIIDDYSAAYLQGKSNSLETTLANTMAQTEANKRIARIRGDYGVASSMLAGVNNFLGGVGNMAAFGPAGVLGSGISGFFGMENQYRQAQLSQEERNITTGVQGNVTNQNAINSLLATKQDIKNVADNVNLQGGDVYFTFQNQFNGYCLVYKQISWEYIRILEDYFKKYGYAYRRIETPVLHTRKSYDYIKTIDCNIMANINNDSLMIIKDIFDKGVTIWHTNDIGNYSLNNDEI